MTKHMQQELGSIGADPEVFLADTRTGGVFPVCGLIAGTKEKPLALPDRKKYQGSQTGYFMQEDNVMAEFNIPPVTNAEEFTLAIHHALAGVRNHITSQNKNIDVCSGHSFVFSEEVLTKHKEKARTFGCSPDYNAYSKESGTVPNLPMHVNNLYDLEGQWRFAGGHIHIAPSKYAPKIPPNILAKFADLFLGLPSISVDKQRPVTGQGRRYLYGRAGTFRPTPYGIEYRVLSNFWVFDRQTTLDIATRAFNLIGFLNMYQDRLEELQEVYRKIPWVQVTVAINAEKEHEASDLIQLLTEMKVLS